MRDNGNMFHIVVNFKDGNIWSMFSSYLLYQRRSSERKVQFPAGSGLCGERQTNAEAAGPLQPLIPPAVSLLDVYTSRR